MRRELRGICVVGALAAAVFARGDTPLLGQAAPAISEAERSATFTYGPGVQPYDRQLIEAAVAGANPAARALIEQIDGITQIEVGPTPAGAAGVTMGDGHRFTVLLDMGTTHRQLGVRGVNRLVLHELGHVVDGALVPRDLHQRLDAGIPPGQPCPAGAPLGACAPSAERFAETFAKWAMADIGVDLYIGYYVPPPGDLEAWAAPLAGLDT